MSPRRFFVGRAVGFSVLILLAAAVWLVVRQVPPEQATDAYRDDIAGFSITLPTALATSTDAVLWSVDRSYRYAEMGPGKEIVGVKFGIPSSLAEGTNLSSDSYLSVEHLPAGAACTATAFLDDPYAKAQTLREEGRSYSVASSSGAAVGNRYDETVYALESSDPCLAVRYFIHYGAIENYADGMVREFDEAALLSQFDEIRRTLTTSQ